MKIRRVFILAILVIIGIILFVFWNNQVVSKVILDINPSIEIDLKRGNKVRKVIALNDDARDIISDDMVNRSLEDTLNLIVDRVYGKKIIKEDTVLILLANESPFDSDNIKHIIEARFNEKHIHTDVLIIDNISNEDRALAKKYNISPAKAAYVNMVANDNNNLKIENLINNSLSLLKEMKETGNYCEDGYILDGSYCLKEKEQKIPTIGNVCPQDYYDYNGTCYYLTASVDSDEYGCPKEFKLTDDKKCVGVERIDAIGNFTCEVGKLVQRGEIANRIVRDAGDSNEYLCEDQSTAKYPTERCYLQEHAIINGKCAMGPKPLLPTATGCEGHDINYNGGCYDPAPSEPYVCPNGERRDTNTELCPDTFKYVKAQGNYTCKDGYKLDGSKCTKELAFDAGFKQVCPEGYTIVNEDRCINLNKTTNYVLGNICDMPDSRLSNGMCILYERVDALHK